MSNYHYPPQRSPFEEEEDFDFSSTAPTYPIQPQAFPQYSAQSPPTVGGQMPFFNQRRPFYQHPGSFQQPFESDASQHPLWTTPTPIVPSNAAPHTATTFPQYAETYDCSHEMTTAGPSATSMGYLSPEEAAQTRPSRSTSLASNASSAASVSRSDVSRSVSPNASEMAKWGYRNESGSWTCAYPGCGSKSTFNRGCDLRKHYKRHSKSLFCRHDGCPQAIEGGFSSKKDRARHEAKHNPNIVCEWEACDRLFSRVDNMKDHVRRVHKRKLAQ